jgi:hypothetical protein
MSETGPGVDAKIATTGTVSAAQLPSPKYGFGLMLRPLQLLLNC